MRCGSVWVCKTNTCIVRVKVPTCIATAFIFHSLAARRSISTVVLLLNELAGPLQVFFHRLESSKKVVADNTSWWRETMVFGPNHRP